MITLIGVKQAREGFTFIHQGASPHCEGCKYYQVCIENLEAGRVYEVVGLREKVFSCKLHEAGVRVVEVSESEIKTAISPKLAIEGATISFQPQECDLQTCKNYEMCVPCGLRTGDRCIVLKISDAVECSKNNPLIFVVLRRLHAS